MGIFDSPSFISQKIDSLVEQRIAERYAEKEKQLKERDRQLKERDQQLTARLNKSREYRIMLRDYQQELREREAALDKRERDIFEKEATIKERVQRDAIKREQDAQRALEQLKEYQAALRRTEMTIIDWVKRKEAQDIEVFTAIMEDSNKLQKYMPRTEKMDGFQFESYVSELLLKNSFEDVVVTQKAQDFGADITAKKNSIEYVFQCKYYNSPVGIEAVQQIYSSKIHYNAHVAVVVTNNIFTKAAKVLAKETNVLLWDCEKLNELEQL